MLQRPPALIHKNPSLPARLLAGLALGICIAVGAAERTTGEFTTINGIEIYHAIEGNGDPLLLLHGGLGHSGAWKEQIAALKPHFRVITMDSRGHGRSGFDATPISYALMAKDVLALLDQLGIQRTHILGWSDGGIIGLELAIHHPERLNKLIAFGANYHPSGVRKDIGDNERFNKFIAQAATDYKTISPAPQRWQEFLDNIGQMWASQPDYSEAQLGAIKLPVLVLAGLDEEAIEIEHVRRTAALIPNAVLELMPGTGHFAHWERSEAFNRIVLEFLR